MIRPYSSLFLSLSLSLSLSLFEKFDEAHAKARK